MTLVFPLVRVQKLVSDTSTVSYLLFSSGQRLFHNICKNFHCHTHQSIYCACLATFLHSMGVGKIFHSPAPLRISKGIALEMYSISVVFFSREPEYNRSHIVCRGKQRTKQVFLSVSHSVQISVMQNPGKLGQFLLQYKGIHTRTNSAHKIALCCVTSSISQE